MSDDFKRHLAAESRMAVQALETATWRESAKLMADAEALYSRQELTPEKAQTILIGILEQRKAFNRLVSQVAEGVRATQRIADREAAQVAVEAKERDQALYGRNRFTRSKVPPIPDRPRRETA